jgi:RNA polymerase primary sigma factor
MGGRSRDEDEDLDEILARAGKNAPAKESDDSDDEPKLRILLTCLDAREEEVVRLRYGIGREVAMTLDAIGDSFDPPMTRERVRQIETHALRTMLRAIDEEEGRD